MKVAVLGNSHLASVRDGAEVALAGRNDIELRYFGVPTSSAWWFRLTRERIIRANNKGDPSKTTPGFRRMIREINGAGGMPLGDADAILWVGMQRSHRAILNFVGTCDVEGHPDRLTDMAVSERAFRAFCRSAAEADLPTPNWRAATGVQQFMIASPSPAESVFERKLVMRKNPTLRSLREHPTGVDRLMAIYLSEATAVYGAANVEFMPQPPETLADGVWTKSTYTQGERKRLVGGGRVYNERDPFHMNGEYGALALSSFLRCVDARANQQEVL